MFSWVSRFISNCRINNTQETKQGPIVTEDIVAQLLKIIKQYQLEFNLGGDFQKESLNLQCMSLYVCHGRIKGDYPLYIPRTLLLV